MPGEEKTPQQLRQNKLNFNPEKMLKAIKWGIWFYKELGNGLQEGKLYRLFSTSFGELGKRRLANIEQFIYLLKILQPDKNSRQYARHVLLLAAAIIWDPRAGFLSDAVAIFLCARGFANGELRTTAKRHEESIRYADEIFGPGVLQAQINNNKQYQANEVIIEDMNFSSSLLTDTNCYNFRQISKALVDVTIHEFNNLSVLDEAALRAQHENTRDIFRKIVNLLQGGEGELTEELLQQYAGPTQKEPGAVLFPAI